MMRCLICQWFVVKHAVAVALKVRVFNLVFEFLTHAFGGVRAFPSARAVAAGSFKPFFYSFDNFFVWI